MIEKRPKIMSRLPLINGKLFLRGRLGPESTNHRACHTGHHAPLISEHLNVAAEESAQNPTGKDLIGCSIFDDPALVQQHDLIHGPGQFIQVMGYDDHGRVVRRR